MPYSRTGAILFVGLLIIWPSRTPAQTARPFLSIDENPAVCMKGLSSSADAEVFRSASDHEKEQKALQASIESYTECLASSYLIPQERSHLLVQRAKQRESLILLFLRNDRELDARDQNAALGLDLFHACENMTGLPVADQDLVQLILVDHYINTATQVGETSVRIDALKAQCHVGR